MTCVIAEIWEAYGALVSWWSSCMGAVGGGGVVSIIGGVVGVLVGLYLAGLDGDPDEIGPYVVVCGLFGCVAAPLWPWLPVVLAAIAIAGGACYGGYWLGQRHRRWAIRRDKPKPPKAPEVPEARVVKGGS